MSTIEWFLLCSIIAMVFLSVGIFIGVLLAASKDETVARNCTKCREAMQVMAKKPFFAVEGEE